MGSKEFFTEGGEGREKEGSRETEREERETKEAQRKEAGDGSRFWKADKAWGAGTLSSLSMITPWGGCARYSCSAAQMETKHVQGPDWELPLGCQV